MEHAGTPQEFAQRLGHIIGPRPGDVLRMSQADIADDALRVRPRKTRVKLRIEIGGELKALLGEVAACKTTQTATEKVRSPARLINERNQKLTEAMLRNRFDGTRAAQAPLGNTTETMTPDCIRHKMGKTVTPSR